MLDNNKAVAHVNNIGKTRSDLCDDIAFDTWQWDPDKNSRMLERSLEWKLTENVFNQIVTKFGKINLLEPRISYQIIYLLMHYV